MKKLRLKINRNSLKWRWFVNVLGVVVLTVLIIEVIGIIFMHSYYYNSVKSDLDSYVGMATGRLSEYSESNASEFEKAAQNYVNSYSDRNKAEAQIISHDGRIIASSLGVVQEYDTSSAKNKKQTKSNIYGCFIHHGEQRLYIAESNMTDTHGNVFGTVRFIAGVDRVEKQVFYNSVVIVAIGMAVVFIVFLLGIYFLRSILKPINNITHLTERIASGKFDERIEASGEGDEIAKLCDSINFMASELSHADSIKNEFISSVSHELRTPLTAIKGWGETVKDCGVDDPLILEKGINIILNETERMEGLVEDLLDFSRIESGRLQVNLKPMDILAELEQTVYMYAEAASKLGINISYDAPESVPPVNADKNRIKQVFINIIDNAVKYSKEGTTVSIEVSVHDVFVRVCVRDMGCGIAKADLPRVKEKFYKANQTVRGSGIGLAVADEIVRQHNGFLEIDSVEGYGTTVLIELPFIADGEKGESL